MDSPVSTPAAPAPTPVTAAESASLRKFLITCLVLLGCFSLPLYHVAWFALKSELYSYILIVPFISGYLVWIDRRYFFPMGPRIQPGWSVALFGGGLASLIAALLLLPSAGGSGVDSLALFMYSLVLLIAAAACFFLGRQSMKLIGFPLAFLLFLAPFPVAVEAAFETMLQHGSSWVAHKLFELASMPVYRESTYFQLPGFSMQVAPECSGIRSTLALFLTSLVAGRLFMRSPWKRTTLALIVLPIALLRNGFRVFVIGELCVQIGPHMINSWIHRHGGPAFFALSLIPFSLILYYFYKSDLRSSAATKSTS